MYPGQLRTQIRKLRALKAKQTTEAGRKAVQREIDALEWALGDLDE